MKESIVTSFDMEAASARAIAHHCDLRISRILLTVKREKRAMGKHKGPFTWLEMQCSFERLEDEIRVWAKDSVSSSTDVS